MESLKSTIRLSLIVTLLVLLVAVAFVSGYKVGGKTEIASDRVVERVTLSPTSTPLPTSAQDTTPLTTPEDMASPAESSGASFSPTLETAQDPELTQEANLPSDEETLRVLLEVWDFIEAEFYGELPAPEERVYGAIRGMLGTLNDDYTSFVEPDIAAIQRADLSGSFEGIGALVRINEEGILEIVSLFEGQPADEAGLLPEDRVLAVDGESIVGYGIYEAIALIRGPEGEEVVLTIQRGAGTEPFDVPIVRARIDIPIIESRMLEENIGYISLFDFSSQATLKLKETINSLMDQGATALILDLRGNPGGLLDQAVRVSDLFLDDQGIILIERFSDGQEHSFPSTDEGLAQDIPLAVLVNGGSASAAEIVAGALQDRERAVLIGETTFGKGSVQLPHTLSDGSELRVTIRRWFTPNDRAIHGEGLIPDIEVPFTLEDAEAGLDPQLDRAIEYLKTGQ
ncbi:MAG: S41 family peptidase [Anaerolineae bacterium]|jgi:carboxyl-terminal processing protease